ncbi:glycosyltransferase family 61 protein [Halovivax limisalsi]|uniref:glycosyltransferase family 61 protein n=1 Tax=Halovivax limisalsi TaxID=1453760 RepID=UPI001FFCC39C|nr:glycosyltransferase family 61 protein [Halovivax limisalsi]
MYLLKEAPGHLRPDIRDQLSYRWYNPYGHVTRGELRSQCDRADSIWYYGSRERFEIAPPISGPPPELFDGVIGTHEVPRSFVCEVPSVRLFGDWALSQRLDGTYVVEEMGHESTLRNRLLETFRSFGIRRRVSEIAKPSPEQFARPDFETIINLVPRHGGRHNNYVNFGHWILEDLPRLRGYHRYYEATGRKPTLLLKNDPPSWMIETLTLLGFSSSDWTEWNRESATVSRLVVPKLSYIHSVGAEYQPSDRKWVVDRMKSAVDLSTDAAFPERVFVSRQGQDRRKIANYDAVMETLSEFGFESIRPEELSIESQIRLFDQAEVVVGPFGANLTNVVFATDATLIEIFPPGAIKTVFYIVASEQGLRYDFVRGDLTEDGPANTPRNSDIVVPLEDLTAKLDALELDDSGADF